MKIILIITSLIAAFIAACSSPLEDKEKCPCNVKLHTLQEDGTYKRSVFKLQTLENPRAVSSSKIRITLNPKFYMDGTTGDTTPEAQYFVDKDGNIVPKTTLTEELFSIYKIMEDFYFFDMKTGIDQVLFYPRNVSIHNKTPKAGEKDNAFYISSFDRIVVLSYKGKRAPLGMNKGVLAHEHFHAIFNKIISPVKNTINDKNYVLSLFGLLDEGAGLYSAIDVDLPDEQIGYNYLLLRALDEGMADFWANLHTNISNSYKASYSPEDQLDGRAVEGVVSEMFAQNILESALNIANYRKEIAVNGSAYRPTHDFIYVSGSKYSNLIKSLSDKIYPLKGGISLEERNVLVGKWIVQSLNKLSQTVAVQGRLSVLSQADILESFVPHDRKDILKDICSDFDSFLAHHSKVKSCSGY